MLSRNAFRRIVPGVAALTLAAAIGLYAQSDDRDRASREASDVAQTPLLKLRDGQRQFAADLYPLLGERAGNFLFSPYSIQQALALTYAGACGATADQMASAARFTDLGDELATAFGHLNAKVLAQRPRQGPDDSKLALHIANRLWGQQGIDWKGDFVKTLKAHYGAPLETVDFRRDAEGARTAINDWVAEQTRDRIQDLFGQGSIHSDTRLVLANAIYMKAAWLHPFSLEKTGKETFHLLDGRTIKTPMMHQTERFLYRETDGVQVAALPYAGGLLAMVVMLPPRGAFEDWEKSLDGEALADLLGDLQPAKLKLALPRFEYTSSFGLVEPLSRLGMPDAFAAGRADFTGMTADEDLHIDAVVHKAFISVDEEGTEAAAATGVAVGTVSIEPPTDPIEMRVDRPFVFVIRHTPTGAILFMGRVVDPRGEE